MTKVEFNSLISLIEKVKKEMDRKGITSDRADKLKADLLRHQRELTNTDLGGFDTISLQR